MSRREIEKFLSQVRVIDEAFQMGDIPHAVKCLGDKLNFSTAKFPIGEEELSLVKKARVLSRRYGEPDYENRILDLLSDINKAGPNYSPPRKQTSIFEQIPFDESKVEEITCKTKRFPELTVYRSPQTRKLDDVLKIKEIPYYIGFGHTEIELSNIMPFFSDLAKEIGFYAGVKKDLLASIAEMDMVERTPDQIIAVHAYKKFVQIEKVKETEVVFPTYGKIL